MRSHEIDYRIEGHDIQFVEIELDPGETVIAEAGSMFYMEEGITFETRLGDGSEASSGVLGKLWSAAKRGLTGESIFLTHFTNMGTGKQRVAFSAPYPGTIVPIDLAALGGQVILQKDAFLCAAKGTHITITFNQRLGATFFGGEGFILEKLVGNGLAFVHAGGTVVEKELHGETLRVDTGCLVGFEPAIDYSIARAGNLTSMFFGGEGIFLATLSGTGKVWLQSMPVRKLIQQLTPGGENSRKGESSFLGGLFE